MSEKLKVLDLFSGIGSFSLGLERTGGFETVAFCEIEEFPRKVLRKHWPEVPIFEDVRTLKGSDIGAVDVICGGYPCQPFSTAGQRRGAEDDRHLWPEFNRLVAELRPTWVIGENVSGHISMGLDSVLSDLEGQGYAARTFVIPACAVDAKHRRDRVWTVAHATGERRGKTGQNCKRSEELLAGAGALGNTSPAERERGGDTRSGGVRSTDTSQDVADASGGRQSGSRTCRNASDQAQGGERQATQPVNGCIRGKRRTESGMGGMADGLPAGMDGPCRWPREPDIPRVAKGVKDRTNRLKALGNAVVPQIPEMIGHAILEAERQQND